MRDEIKRVELALAALKQGKMVILTDDPDRENEGDLIIPAEKITPEIMNFMIRNGTGIVCLSMTAEDLARLQLPLMVNADNNTSFRGTPFTISIDAKENITTGVSADDRTKTILTAIADHATPQDLVRPGHIYPLQANADGVLARQGHTEGSLDLAKLAGFKPAAVLCEIMNPDGSMARGEDLTAFAAKHDLFMLSISDIIHYRRVHENLIETEVETTLPLEKYGNFTLHAVREKISGAEHLVLSKPPLDSSQPLLVRIHSACTTGDIFGSCRCDCNHQLHQALSRISKEGGILIYLNQEGRGIGLFNKIKTYALQDQGLDTVEANIELGLPVDARHYAFAANILRERGISHVRLLTNNPEKMADLKRYGISHVEREPLSATINQFNEHYLKVKCEKLHQDIRLDLQQAEGK
jgi:3,4-dihydroxy 2-butanone 4-phosphate synthase / GTP cyclohydrolase II